MIGKIYISMVEFYDVKNQKNLIKKFNKEILENILN